MGTSVMVSTIKVKLKKFCNVYSIVCTFSAYEKNCPGWHSSVDWEMACEPKGHWFNSQSGHRPGLQARSPVGDMQEATTHGCLFPLSPSLPLSLKINKSNLNKKKTNRIQINLVLLPLMAEWIAQVWFPENHFFKKILLTKRERKRERERNIYLLFHLLMHSSVDSYMCPDRGIKPATLVYRDHTLNNWATQPGHDK